MWIFLISPLFSGQFHGLRRKGRKITLVEKKRSRPPFLIIIKGMAMYYRYVASRHIRYYAIKRGGTLILPFLLFRVFLACWMLFCVERRGRDHFVWWSASSSPSHLFPWGVMGNCYPSLLFCGEDGRGSGRYNLPNKIFNFMLYFVSMESSAINLDFLYFLQRF